MDDDNRDDADGNSGGPHCSRKPPCGGQYYSVRKEWRHGGMERSTGLYRNFETLFETTLQWTLQMLLPDKHR